MYFCDVIIVCDCNHGCPSSTCCVMSSWDIVFGYKLGTKNGVTT